MYCNDITKKRNRTRYCSWESCHIRKRNPIFYLKRKVNKMYLDNYRAPIQCSAKIIIAIKYKFSGRAALAMT